MRGIPQGDPICPWILNAIMAAWIRCLSRKPSITRVFLDDRALLDPDPGVLSTALDETTAFDFSFGLMVNTRKSSRLVVGQPHTRARATSWEQLPLHTKVKYLGAIMDSKADSSMTFGTKQVQKVLPLLRTVVHLPHRDIRMTLAMSYLQGLNSGATTAPMTDLDLVQTAITHAFWGSHLNPNNTMRSVAVTLGLFVPLHRASPHIQYVYLTILALADLGHQAPYLLHTLWEQRHQCWRSLLGFYNQSCAALFICSGHGPVLSNSKAPTIIISLNHLHRGADNHEAKRHRLRDALRDHWRATSAPLRPCLTGASAGIDRDRSLAPVRQSQTFNDGACSFRYTRFLANALWSRRRLHFAGHVSDTVCLRCLSAPETTLGLCSQQ